MNNFFVRKYSSIKDSYFYLKKLKVYAIQRLLIRTLANVMVPIWFVLSRVVYKKKLNEEKRDKQIIISLTTFPVRINRIWIVIECMLRQSVAPDRIILWLSKNQFNGESSLPKSLRKLQNRGLEIVFCDGDIRSHKKYYYSFKNFPKDFIITIDDDFIYSSFLIEELMTTHQNNPGLICCNRAVRIKIRNNVIMPYNQWKFEYSNTEPSFELFFTSGGGTLFPGYCLHQEVLNAKVFLDICKYADDVWLNLMAQMNHTKIIKTYSKYDIVIPLFYINNLKLSSFNVDESLNDKQLNDVRRHYKERLSSDPFNTLLNK